MIKETAIFDFRFKNINDIADKGLMQDLLDEKITGIIFRNFLSAEEVSSVKSAINLLPRERWTIINEGFHTYPVSFAQFTQMKKAGAMSIENYVALAGNVLQNQESEIGLNITERLIEFLMRNEIFREVSPIIEAGSGKPLIPFNVRQLFPGTGELVVHCENLFFEEFPDFFNWLKLMDIKDNKLSYFITVQKPDVGGELCCYGLNWENVKSRESHTVLKDLSGNTIDIHDENLPKQLISPNEGDLILFAGGNVWHKVLTVEGTKSRITIGGFVAETNINGKYYVWS